MKPAQTLAAFDRPSQAALRILAAYLRRPLTPCTAPRCVQIRPALLTGSLGYAFGTLIGVALANMLRMMA